MLREALALEAHGVPADGAFYEINLCHFSSAFP